MDEELILEFEQWYKSQINLWKMKGVSIDKIYDSPYAVQRHIELSSPYALAHVALFQSNGYCWVDFEIESLVNDESYLKANIDFSGVDSIKIQTEKLNQYLMGESQ